jgi:hypothetical protein
MNDVYQVDDESDTEVELVEALPELGIMTYVFGSLMGILWLISVYLLFRYREFSLRCDGIGSLFDTTFYKRFFILAAASLMLYFQTDAVTLSLFLAIVYTTIFHDIFFRDCEYVNWQIAGREIMQDARDAKVRDRVARKKWQEEMGLPPENPVTTPPKEGEFGHSLSDRIWLSLWPMPDR